MKIDGEYLVGAAPAEVVAAAIRSEDRGWDGALSTETAYDPFLPLAVAAERTRSIELGTAVAVALARSPLTLAHTANDLQFASRGRFVLGLGTQVRAHVVRRFSMPWSRPSARIREQVLAMRAIWNAWNTGDTLDFQGDFYSHTLMTPMFSPPPNPHGEPRILLAAVGERMAEVAGEVADGIIAHPFSTPRYLREVLLPAARRGRVSSTRASDGFAVSLPVMVATGNTEEELRASIGATRDQIRVLWIDGRLPARAGNARLR